MKFFIFICLFLITYGYHNKNHKLRFKKKSKCDGWPLTVVESIRDKSKGEDCSDEKCRTWDEIKDTAWCRAQLLIDKNLLRKGQGLYYASTEYRTVVQHDWAKFFWMEKSVQPETMDLASFHFLYRVCVPVDKKINGKETQSWISNKCINEPCQDYATLRPECKL